MNQQFYQWLSERISQYVVARDRALQAYRTRLSNISEVRNGGVAPTESEAGIHAPFDGYAYSWCKGDEVFEKTFLAGQFLPWPSDYESYSVGSFTESTRIDRVPESRIKEFLEEYKNLPESIRQTVSVSHGQSWVDSSDETVCHVYVSKCPADLCQAIEYYLMGDIYKLQFIAEQKTESVKEARDKAHSEGEDVTEGRQVINGTVLAMKSQESDWGSVLKMLVQDDRGFRVWGSVPSSLDCSREDQITFTATIQQSDDDAKFGFFKRPTKASVV
jgi:hypothetical protein|tara:strand:- start:1974 stop:2795 length:822 start_codon:yes stop_codon:yes gene_type:complete